MNFGLDDIINKTFLGTPEKDLQDFAAQFNLPLNEDFHDKKDNSAKNINK